MKYNMKYRNTSYSLIYRSTSRREKTIIARRPKSPLRPHLREQKTEDAPQTPSLEDSKTPEAPKDGV